MKFYRFESGNVIIIFYGSVILKHQGNNVERPFLKYNLMARYFKTQKELSVNLNKEYHPTNPDFVENTKKVNSFAAKSEILKLIFTSKTLFE